MTASACQNIPDITVKGDEARKGVVTSMGPTLACIPGEEEGKEGDDAPISPTDSIIGGPGAWSSPWKLVATHHQGQSAPVTATALDAERAALFPALPSQPPAAKDMVSSHPKSLYRPGAVPTTFISLPQAGEMKKRAAPGPRLAISETTTDLAAPPEVEAPADHDKSSDKADICAKRLVEASNRREKKRPAGKAVLAPPPPPVFVVAEPIFARKRKEKKFTTRFSAEPPAAKPERAPLARDERCGGGVEEVSAAGCGGSQAPATAVPTQGGTVERRCPVEDRKRVFAGTSMFQWMLLGFLLVYALLTLLGVVDGA